MSRVLVLLCLVVAAGPRPALGQGSLAGAHAFPVPYVPSKQSTRVITFTGLPAQATIRIYAADGVLIRTLEESDGDGRRTWDVKDDAGKDAAGGVYLYAISSGGERATGLLLVVR